MAAREPGTIVTSSLSQAGWEERTLTDGLTVHAKYLLAAPALGRLRKDGFRIMPAGCTWLIVGAIFAEVSVWLW